VVFHPSHACYLRTGASVMVPFVAMVAAFMGKETFDGYQLFSSIDISIDLHDPLCDNPAPIPEAAVAAVCDAIKCDHYHAGTSFSHPCIKRWSFNDTMDSYISLKTCGSGSPPPEIVNGSCNEPSRKYLKCSNGGAEFAKLNTFALPPSLIKSSCDQDERCAAFIVKKDQSSGTTLSWKTDQPSYVALPSS